jgi:polyisoprenoid-binding protein YceI
VPKGQSIVNANLRSPMVSLMASFVFAALLAIAANAASADDTGPAPAVVKNEPAKGDVDVERSRVYVFVGKTGFGHEHGVVGRLKSGSVRLGAKRNAGQLEFDIASFQADTADARRYVGLSGETDASTQEQVTTNMVGKYVLDSEQYPTAAFVIDSALPLRGNRPNGQRRFQLDGKFTLHGATRPLRIIAQATVESGAVRLRGSFNLLQTEYHITPFTKAFGAVGVTDKLKIYGDIRLISLDN